MTEFNLEEQFDKFVRVIVGHNWIGEHGVVHEPTRNKLLQGFKSLFREFGEELIKETEEVVRIHDGGTRVVSYNFKLEKKLRELVE